MSQMLIIAGLAGVGVLATQTPKPVTKPNDGGTLRGSLRDRFGHLRPVQGGSTGVYDATLVAGRFDIDGQSVETRELQDKLLARVKKEYDALSAEGKAKVCAELKKQYPESSRIQALDCKSSTWENIASVGLGVAGAAGGAALCGPPCATLGGVLGSAVGKVIGKEIGEFLTDAWDEVEEASSDAIDYLTDLVSW